MEGFLYEDDVENEQKSIRRLALTEESLNRTLLNDGEKNHLKQTFSCLTYFIAGSIVCLSIILIILFIKHLL